MSTRGEKNVTKMFQKVWSAEGRRELSRECGTGKAVQSRKNITSLSTKNFEATKKFVRRTSFEINGSRKCKALTYYEDLNRATADCVCLEGQ